MDVGTVNLLARMHLAAKRRGVTLRVLHAGDGLLELIDFVGLSDVLCLELQREPEQREQALGVKKERELDDPAF